MEIRKLKESDAESFSKLIVNMYSNLNNLEWFSPMPYDLDSAKTIISKERFYVLGAFIDENLIGVSSLDYKCGKLIGKVDFPKECNTEKLVEIGFSLVHSDFRGRKIMKSLVEVLINKLKEDGYEWAFAKIHKNNIASLKSCLNNNFYVFSDYRKLVDKADFVALSSQEFFSKEGKQNALQTLERCKNQEQIDVDYKILMKKL